MAHKARVTELEVQMQKLKDALLEKERGEREAQRREKAEKEKEREKEKEKEGSNGKAVGDDLLDDL